MRNLDRGIAQNRNVLVFRIIVKWDPASERRMTVLLYLLVILYLTYVKTSVSRPACVATSAVKHCAVEMRNLAVIISQK